MLQPLPVVALFPVMFIIVHLIIHSIIRAIEQQQLSNGKYGQVLSIARCLLSHYAIHI